MTEFLQLGSLPLMLTLLAFFVAQGLQKKFKSPLLSPTLVAAIFLILFLLCSKMDTAVYTRGADKISWLMTPATICLAIPMYQQFSALKKNLKAIAIGVAAGAVSCMAVMLLAGTLLGLSRELTVSMLPKSVTTAIGLSLSELFGGLPGVSGVAIIITGIFGNVLGVSFCKLFHITHPIAQGVAFGTASHVIGTSKAEELDPLCGAVSSVSLVTAGVITAIIMPIFSNFL